jgi:hypothetical protein
MPTRYRLSGFDDRPPKHGEVELDMTSRLARRELGCP